MTFQPGDFVGAIEIRQVLAREESSSHESYLGYDPRLERVVRIERVVSERLSEQQKEELIERMRRYSRLHDPRLSRVLDFVEGDERGGTDLIWFFEQVDGRPITEQELAALARREKLDLAQEIAEVLFELHRHGIAHGGLSQDRVLLRDSGSILVQVPLTASGDPSLANGSRLDRWSEDCQSYGRLLAALFESSGSESLGRRFMARLCRWQSTDSAPPTLPEVIRELSLERSRPKRQRRITAVATLLAIGLLSASIYTVRLTEAVRQTQASTVEAELARSEAQELSQFMVGLFRPDEAPVSEAPVSEAPGSEATGAATTRTILDRGVERIDREFGERPVLRARVALTLGQVFQTLGEYERADQLLRSSLEQRRSLPVTDPLLVAESLDALATNQRYLGDYDSAREGYSKALELRQSTLGSDHERVADSLNGLAIVARLQGDYEQAESHYLRALEIRRTRFGEDAPIVARTLNNLALLYNYQGRLDRAEELYRQALAAKERTLEANHPSIARSLNNLSNLLADQGRVEEAEAGYRRAFSIWQEVGGPDHPEAAASANNLGLLFGEAGRLAEAEEFLEAALAIRRRSLGAGHPSSARSLSNLGSLLITAGRFDEAERHLQEALVLQQAALGGAHADVGLTLDRLAALRLAEGEPRAAQELLVRSERVNREALGADHPDTAYSRYLLALADAALGNVDSALEELSAVIELYEGGGASRHQIALAERALTELLKLSREADGSVGPQEIAGILLSRSGGPQA